ncbi:hypothetical protein MMB17_11310 [Methylobacterium organophilum]|nr:hypothetical protein [Methylobacterium organophilum]UMY19829.1 hypothetical protein MMB17_11310 [Methylobacterium organophilum]
MPNYFFDIDDGDHASIDYDWLTLKDVEELRSEAVKTLLEIAQDTLP